MPNWQGGRFEGNTAVEMSCPQLGWNIRVPVKVEAGNHGGGHASASHRGQHADPG